MDNTGYFMHRVGELGSKNLVTCDVEDSISQAARLMTEVNTSSIVVLKEGLAAGIITDRDLRRYFGEHSGSGDNVKAGEVMSSPLHTLPPEARVYDAIQIMIRQRIHHVVVVNEAGEPTAVLSDTDLLMAQADSPFLFGRTVEEATNLDELRAINQRMKDVVISVFNAGGDITSTTRMVTTFYDAFTSKVLDLLVEERIPDLMGRFAFLVCGSEGRKEQTLKTDQDNAIVYADDLTPDEMQRLGEFSVVLRDSLVYIGIPPCPGDMMASNPLWRKSQEEWCDTVDRWIMNITPENITNFGMFCDFRTIWGPTKFELTIKNAIYGAIAKNSMFLHYMARNILRFPPPLSFFGHIKTEGKGPNEGKVDIKKAGFFSFTEGMTLLGLEAGFLEGSTLEKIKKLRGMGAIDRGNAKRYVDAFSYLFNLRLRHQIDMLQKGLPPDNMVDPEELSLFAKAGLEETLKVVKHLHSFIRDKFNVDIAPH